MFPRDFYEILHIVGIAMLFVAIGGVATHAANGGTKTTSSTRPLVGSIYGIGAFLILLGGFGMLARLGFLHGANFPGWLWVKIIIWVILSAVVLLLWIPLRERPGLCTIANAVVVAVALQVGVGLTAGTQMGPLANERRLAFFFQAEDGIRDSPE